MCGIIFGRESAVPGSLRNTATQHTSLDFIYSSISDDSQHKFETWRNGLWKLRKIVGNEIFSQLFFKLSSQDWCAYGKW